MPSGLIQPELFQQEGARPPANGYALIAFERGIDISEGGLTYQVPKHLADLQAGERVVAPLGRGGKPNTGYVIQRLDQPKWLIEEKAKGKNPRVKEIIKKAPGHIRVPSDMIELAKWISKYYCCPLGMVFATMLPAAVKRGTGTVSRLFVQLGRNTDLEKIKLSKLQRKVLTQAKAAHQNGQPWIEINHLASQAGAKTSGPVKKLVDQKILQTKRVEQIRSDLDLRAGRQPYNTKNLALNSAQQTALDYLTQNLDSGFHVSLLHGVTGSGKTEVYLRLIEALNEKAKGAVPGVIVLVPEIALTPQTVARFRQRFDKVAVLHSGLTAAQRNAQWQRLLNGEAQIAIGARSAIFAPVKNLSLIIVDEEHETSYKQDQLPRYSGRDVAVKRGQIGKFPVVLGSATPSLESYHNTKSSYQLLALPDRAPGMKLPKVEIVDMVEDRRQRKGVHLISSRLEVALSKVFSSPANKPGGRAILLLNRRGFGNYIACPDHRCGWMMRCEHCDASLVYHKDGALPAGGVVRCHHCTCEQMLAKNCPTCGKKVTVFGLGVQRVEQELHKKLPAAKVIRMDSDTMRTASHYQKALDDFKSGQADILLGTQMVAKGLDIDTVRIVGVISGDTALHMPDFRAAERTFQLISQVAGRAGRSTQRGLALVQSYSANDPTIALAAQHDYNRFAKRELEIRAEMNLPPFSRMARIVVRDKDHQQAVERGQKMAEKLRQFAAGSQNSLVEVRGPFACPIARIADFHRQQIEIFASAPGAASALQRVLSAARKDKLLLADAKTAVDVDPVAMM